VIDAPFVNHPDTETILKQLKVAKNKLVTIEDHQVTGGMGSQLVHALAQVDAPFKVRSLGIPGIYGQSAYKASELYDKYGLSVAGIAQAIKSL